MTTHRPSPLPLWWTSSGVLLMQKITLSFVETPVLESFLFSAWCTSQYSLTWFSWWQKVSLPIVCLSISSISPTVSCDIYLQLDSFYFALKSSTRSHNEFIFLMYWCWDLTKCEFLIARAWMASLLVKSLFVLKLWCIFLDVSPSKKDN